VEVKPFYPDIFGFGRVESPLKPPLDKCDPSLSQSRVVSPLTEQGHYSPLHRRQQSPESFVLWISLQCPGALVIMRSDKNRLPYCIFYQAGLRSKAINDNFQEQLAYGLHLADGKSLDSLFLLTRCGPEVVQGGGAGGALVHRQCFNCCGRTLSFDLTFMETFRET
jgi:hypothetical protein